MELKKVTLTNVRDFNIKTFELNNGENSLMMPNRGGKTTLADAITFLLIGKLYSGSSNVASLKSIADTSQPVIVEAVMVSENGDELILKKEYKENWSKVRGTSELQLKGHTTNCWINEKKLTVSNYEKELCGYFGVPSTKEINIMLNPYYFSEVLSWQERLEYVQKVTGEVTSDDVIDCAPLTSKIKPEIDKFGIDEFSKKLKRDFNDKKAKVNEIKIQIKGDSIELIVSSEDYDAAKKECDSNLDAITNKRVKLG